MILYIDGTDFKSFKYALSGKKLVKRSYVIDPHKSHKVLSNLDGFFKSSKIEAKDIKKIVVNKGPGSFTGTRVGVVHALALGFAWNVPVKALEKSKFDEFLA